MSIETQLRVAIIKDNKEKLIQILNDNPQFEVDTQNETVRYFFFLSFFLS